MVKAIVCVVLVAVLSAAAWIRESGKKEVEQAIWWDNQRMLESLRQDLHMSRFRFEKRDTGFNPADLEKARAKKEELAARLEGLEAYRAELADEVQQGGRELAELQQDTLRQIRNRALGKEWKEFVSASGKVFENARVVLIDDAGVTLRHSVGSTRVHFRDLSGEQRAVFGLDAISAAVADAQEKRNAHAYESWLAEQKPAAPAGDDSDEISAERARQIAVAASLERSRRARLASSPATSEAPAAEPERRSKLSEPARLLNPNPRPYRSSRYARGGTTIYYYYTPRRCAPAATLPSYN